MSEKKRLIENKRGQVTIFIIIAILVIAVVVLIYLLFPKIKSTVETQTQSPNEYIQTCISEKLKETVDNVALHGGIYNPSDSISYRYLGENINYICYTNQYYTPCVVQEPLLLQTMRTEIKNEISDDVNSCFGSLVQSYENNGYDASLKYANTESVVELLPSRIVVTFENELTLTKDETETYTDFSSVELSSKLYDLYGVAMSIMTWEELYGSAPVSVYMNYYPDLLIQTHLDLDGTRVYMVEDLESGDQLNFAIRSLVVPPGY